MQCHVMSAIVDFRSMQNKYGKKNKYGCSLCKEPMAIIVLFGFNQLSSICEQHPI